MKCFKWQEYVKQNTSKKSPTIKNTSILYIQVEGHTHNEQNKQRYIGSLGNVILSFTNHIRYI